MALACRPLVGSQWFNVCLIGCMQANALRAGSASLTCLYLSGNSIGSAGIQDLAGMHPVTFVCRREWFLSCRFILCCSLLIRETEAAFLLLSAVFFSRRDAVFCDGSHLILLPHRCGKQAQGFKANLLERESIGFERKKCSGKGCTASSVTSHICLIQLR